MSLWIETAHQCLPRAGEEVCGEAVRTFQTEEWFGAVLAGSPQGGALGARQASAIAGRALEMLQAEAAPDDVAEALIQVSADASAGNEEAVFSVLRVVAGDQAHLVECDTLPLCLIRGGEVAFLPLSEEVVRRRLLREYRFRLQDGDYLVMVSQGFLHPRGWGWGWSDIAVAVRRWTDTGCDADELMSALMRTYRRLNPGAPRWDVTVVAMHVRPERHATVWTGPPADRARDEVALGQLMAGQGTRVICGGTTALIAARLLGAEMKTEARPDDGWAEVPPTSRLDGVDLVTEGLVTLSKARERMEGAQRVRDLPRGEDGATRLARALLVADNVRFLVGLAVNPAQVADTACVVPSRQALVGQLMRDLEARGKLVSVEYL